MIKRTMPAAIAAALAFAALPALASAGYHIDDNNGVGFTVHGEAGEEPFELTGTDGEENTIELSCETVTGNGQFTDNKKGTLQLHFQGCKEQRWPASPATPKDREKAKSQRHSWHSNW